jgi:nitrate reductase NapE component
MSVPGQPAPAQPVAAAQNPAAQPRQREWLVYAALAVAIIAILAQVFVSGTLQYAVVLIGISLIGVFLGVKALKGSKKGIAVSVIILSSLALVSAAVQAGIAINIASKCNNDPAYAAQSAQCQR